MEELDDDRAGEVRRFRVPVVASDGSNTGSLWMPAAGISDRVWTVPPHRGLRERLYVLADGQRFRLLLAQPQGLKCSGQCGANWSPSCGDRNGCLVDVESHAVMVDDAYCVKWLEQHGYDVPAALRVDAQEDARRGSHDLGADEWYYSDEVEDKFGITPDALYQARRSKRLVEGTDCRLVGRRWQTSLAAIRRLWPDATR